jgi:hypothetical protein
MLEDVGVITGLVTTGFTISPHGEERGEAVRLEP